MTREEMAWCDNVTVAGSHPAKYNVWEISQRVIVEGIQGVFVEAGALGGGQIAVMDQALQRLGQSREIHAFDSWEGIPKCLDEDDPPQKAEYGVRQPGEPLASSGKLVGSLENFLANMGKWGARLDRIIPHKGWLQDTLPGWNKPIALLRIDVDITDSVRVCAKYLYPFLVKGGYCIFDDWYTSPSAQRQAMIDAAGIPDMERYVTHVAGNDGTVWWTKP